METLLKCGDKTVTATVVKFKERLELSDEMYEAVRSELLNQCPAIVHFNLDGNLVILRALGLDENGDRYTAENGNLEARKKEIENVVYSVLSET